MLKGSYSEINPRLKSLSAWLYSSLCSHRHNKDISVRHHSRASPSHFVHLVSLADRIGSRRVFMTVEWSLALALCLMTCPALHIPPVSLSKAWAWIRVHKCPLSSVPSLEHNSPGFMIVALMSQLGGLGDTGCAYTIVGTRSEGHDLCTST